MIEPFSKPIYVTKPFLPSLDTFRDGLQEIWDNQWLTNNGPVLQRYTQRLCEYLDTDNICLFNNGTLALQIGLQGMGITGEVITAPFSFVATTHGLFWNKVRPIFVDIEPDYYTLDPAKEEEAITPWTSAILAVHVFGHPCRLDELAEIARRNNLKLIYDAAHAFSVNVGGKSIAGYGDMSMFSFHATKPYHSIEGGMLVFRDGGLKKTFDYLKNFGFENEVEVVMPGTNAKMNEFQALMGEQVLDGFDEQIARRRRIASVYRERLKDVQGISMSAIPAENVRQNHSYIPVEVDEKEFGISRDELYEGLKSYNVYARRYFYPLICDYACYKHVAVNDPLVIARGVAERILTLPIYSDLSSDSVNRICDMITELGSQSDFAKDMVQDRLPRLKIPVS